MSRKLAIVDKLGLLSAQAADLNERIEKLKARVKDKGAGSYNGSLFSATVAERPATIVPRHTRCAGLSVTITARNSAQKGS